MLENIYTTKMSSDKRTMVNRFTKIRSANGRFSKFMTLTMSVVIALTMLCATIVMAAVDEVTSNQDETSNYKNALRHLYSARTKSERDEYIYFGKHSEKYNPVIENDKEYFEELKETKSIEEQNNVSIDVSDDELKRINPNFYYSSKIKSAGEKCQETYSSIDLLHEKNKELLSEIMNNDLEAIDVPDDLFIDKETIYMRGIVIAQVQNAVQKDNEIKGNDEPFSYAVSY